MTLLQQLGVCIPIALIIILVGGLDAKGMIPTGIFGIVTGLLVVAAYFAGAKFERDE